MPQIGHFKRQGDSFSGRVHTFTLDVELTVVPAEPDDIENSPDYRVLRGDDDGREVGAGWTRTSERAGEYVSLQIDDPSFHEPMRARLFQDSSDPTLWSLHWNRQRGRDEGISYAVP